jgi:class 3 adenylate cyclase
MAQGMEPRLFDLIGERGIVFTDLSGYTQLIYHCADDAAKLERVAEAMRRLFSLANTFEDVRVEGYAGDGFLALVGGTTPVRSSYDFGKALVRTFHHEVKGLIQQIGVRVHLAPRVGLHVAKVFMYRVDDRDTALMSDGINAAARIVSSQVSRRHGIAVSRACYRRLLRAGGKEIREPDEVIQDRNQYPEPLEIYRLTAEDEASIEAI